MSWTIVIVNRHCLSLKRLCASMAALRLHFLFARVFLDEGLKINLYTLKRMADCKRITAFVVLATIATKKPANRWLFQYNLVYCVKRYSANSAKHSSS